MLLLAKGCQLIAKFFEYCHLEFISSFEYIQANNNDDFF
jgi:hypothetical protein